MNCRLVQGAVDQPAAGADWSFVPSHSDRVKLLSITAQLVTAAAVANRIVALQYTDEPGAVIWTADVVTPQTASLTVRYSWADGGALQIATAIVAGERVGAKLTDFWLQPGDKVSSVTGAIAAADQWSSIVWRGYVASAWEDLEEQEQLATALGY